MLKVGDTIYITRYALTLGIIKSKVRRLFIDGAAEVRGYYYRPPTSSVHPTQRYYLSEAEALDAAETMRAHKLKLLDKQKAKLAVKKIKVVEL
jgi:hypothetical protein